ncbi:MAG: hypothetical protein OIF51_10740 [Cellvibrionaceae bacterium]|nr:hypothetical protein [Cellvibrionaceae bacterium]
MNVKEFFEKRKLRKFIQKVRAELKERYGGLGPYTYPQVKSTLKGIGSSSQYRDFAYVLFCDPGELEKCGLNSVDISRMSVAAGKIDSQAGHCGSLGGGFGGGDSVGSD